MTTDRLIAHAPRTEALARNVARMTTTCIGCTGCAGLCQAMIEVMILPDVILNPREARA